MSESPGPLTEFAIIERFFSTAALSTRTKFIELGIGDDCALMSLPPDRRLAVSIDTLVAGRHFPDDANPEDVGYRALAVAASDLAAMGAEPVAATLALTVPSPDEQWLARFSGGFRTAMEQFGMSLIGGDTTQGPLCITVQVHGLLPRAQGLLRGGARVGDRVVVSGTLGDARAALAGFRGQLDVDSAQYRYLQQRFYRPQPRLRLGQALLSLANGAIDISDGLLADLGHIADRSGVGARIYLDRLPLSDVLHVCTDAEQARHWALTGGDDYELCFTVSEDNLPRLAAVAEQCDIALTPVGEIVDGRGVQVLDAGGRAVAVASYGFQHFAVDGSS